MGPTAYDANGNLTASTAFPALAYDGVNQATVTVSGQSSLSLAYAGDHQRPAGLRRCRPPAGAGLGVGAAAAVCRIADHRSVAYGAYRICERCSGA